MTTFVDPTEVAATILDAPETAPFWARVILRQPLSFHVLDAAVDAAIQTGIDHPGHGILVTRHDFQMFTVELSKAVQQGTISELDLCLRKSADAC